MSITHSAGGSSAITGLDAEPTPPLLEVGRGQRRAPAVAALVSVVAALAGITLFNLAVIKFDYYPVDETPWLGLPLAVAFSVCGGVLSRFPSARTVAVTMLVCGALAALSLLAAGLNAILWRELPEEFITVFEYVGGLASFTSISTALVLLPQLFPDGLQRGVWRWVALTSTGIVLLTVLGIGVADLISDDGEWLWRAWSTTLLVGMLVGLVSLAVRWWHGSRLTRQQLWAFGLVWSVLGVVLTLSQLHGLGFDADLLLVVWPPITVVVIALAVVRHHLYDVRLTVRRVALYGGSVVILSLLFAAVYFLLLASLSERVAGEHFRWAAVVAATAVILAVDPLRRKVLTRLEHQFLGERSAPLSALARMRTSSADGRHRELDYLAITDAVACALRSPGVALNLHVGNQLQTVALTGAVDPNPLRIPVLHRGEYLGELLVSGRTAGESFQRADLALLDLLVQQAASQIYIVRRDTELAEVRREALDSSAAERARLGQNLHDGIAPLLAGAGLAAEALRRGMPPGSADEHDAAQLANRLRHAATEVRRIAHDLQPAALSRGLEQAIRDQVASLTGPDLPAFSVDIRIDELPVDIAEAVYLIVLEAINNIHHHARARHATIIIEYEHAATDDCLQITVTDDGVGISQPYVSGLGITSMRRRAETFRGSFALQPGAPGGSCLIARIPVHR